MKDKKKILLALQGGGVLGAYTWGVLEGFLRDERLSIAGISGTSAGALNGIVLAHGLIQDGAQGAIKALDSLWSNIHEIALRYYPWLLQPEDLDSSTNACSFLPSLKFSPYTVNPLNFNPLRDMLDSFLDWKAIQKSTSPGLFLAATHVSSGRIKLFKNPELTIDSLMATICWPKWFQAVKVDGEYYWDGGFIANPPIYPLIYDCREKDIVVIPLTLNQTAQVPQSMSAIDMRFSNITVNVSLIRELRMIRLVTQLIDEGKILDPKIRRVNVHIVTNPEALKRKETILDWEYVKKLHAAGLHDSHKWIEKNFDALGTNIPFGFEDYSSYFEV